MQLFRKEKHALRQTNQELMERLKKLWNCYKEKSLERLCSSMNSNSSTPSANDHLKVCSYSNVLLYFYLFLSYPPYFQQLFVLSERR